MDINPHKILIDHINKLILRFGMSIASESVFRLTTLNPDGSNYYQTDIDRELQICEQKELINYVAYENKD